MIRWFIDLNVRLSRGFDRLLPGEYRVDGNYDFREGFAPVWLRTGIRVVDVGGGRHPFIGPETKERLAIHVTGVDICAEELRNAPLDAYDHKICGDIASIVGTRDADLCICQAVLEHVSDVESAFRSIVSFLKPGGVVLIFVPSRNAAFARLNLLLPERFKRFMLFRIFPQAKGESGFPSYYDQCTPRDFRRIASLVGLELADQRNYFCSMYFSFFAPLHVLWRMWIVVFRFLAREQAAETFSMALRRPLVSASSPTQYDAGRPAL